MTAMPPTGPGLPFLKMHGLGNDFVVLDARDRPAARLGEAAVRAVGDRRRGVGFDQLLTLEPSTRADVFLRIHNPDGSESGACGNGTRCVAALVLDETGREAVTIETLNGVLAARRVGDQVTVDMGPPALDWAAIPLARPMDTLRLDFALGPLREPAAVNMGNPHAVFFVAEHPDTIALDVLGPQVETDKLFPRRTNVEAARVNADGSIDLRVWERGAGLTLACGSGACATLVAAARRGLTGRTARVNLPGGTLTIEWTDDNHVWMTGPVATAFAGTLDASLVGA
jgi:diaminopimelate epimerase